MTAVRDWLRECHLSGVVLAWATAAALVVISWLLPQHIPVTFREFSADPRSALFGLAGVGLTKVLQRDTENVDYLTPRPVQTRRAVVWIAAVLAFGAAALIAELTDIAQPLAVLRSSGYSIAIVTILARLGSLDLGSLTVFLIALVNWIFGISTTNLQPHQWAILMTPVTGTTTVISLAIVAISGVWWAAYKQPYLAAD